MVITFTGTRDGLSVSQKILLNERLAWIRKTSKDVVLHHGDCIGADAEADAIAHTLNITVETHPAAVPDKLRAFCQGARRVWPVQPPLTRNRTMVKLADLVIAAPKEKLEVRRSGTWTTIRAAKSLRVPVIILEGEA
jgi:hypothetical protein